MVLSFECLWAHTANVLALITVSQFMLRQCRCISENLAAYLSDDENERDELFSEYFMTKIVNHLTKEASRRRALNISWSEFCVLFTLTRYSLREWGGRARSLAENKEHQSECKKLTELMGRSRERERVKQSDELHRVTWILTRMENTFFLLSQLRPALHFSTHRINLPPIHPLHFFQPNPPLKRNNPFILHSSFSLSQPPLEHIVYTPLAPAQHNFAHSQKIWVKLRERRSA